VNIGLVRGIAAGVAAFLALYFGLKTKLPQEGSGRGIAYVVSIPIYLAVGGGWAAFQSWLNEKEEPEASRVFADSSISTPTTKSLAFNISLRSFFLFLFAGVMALIMRTELAHQGSNSFQLNRTTVMGSTGLEWF
jgi:hypothetical protein